MILQEAQQISDGRRKPRGKSFETFVSLARLQKNRGLRPLRGRRVLDIAQERGQSFIKRVSGQKHIVPRRDRDMRGALRDQPIGERRGFLLWAIQGRASAARMKEPRGK